MTKYSQKFAVLNPSELIDLKFRMDENDRVLLSDHKKTNYRIRNLSLQYNGLYYYADLHLNEKNQESRIVREHYHSQ